MSLSFLLIDNIKKIRLRLDEMEKEILAYAETNPQEDKKEVEPPIVKPKNIVLYVNAGHGGMHPDSGNYMTFPTDGKKYHFTKDVANTQVYYYSAYEGETNRIFAQMMIDIAKEKGIEVVETYHPYLDRYNSERLRIANDHWRTAKTQGKFGLWFSWHSNAVGMSDKGPGYSARGASIFTSGGSTLSDKLATAFWSFFKPAKIGRAHV